MLLSSLACAGAEAGGAGVTVRDSAGIEIVENSSPKWKDGTGWRLGYTPEVDIGVLEGADAYQLFQVRDTKRLSDGRIVVANGGTSELRFYDSDGTYLASSGREGGGPGEFQQLGWMRTFGGDSLMVYDFSLGRMSVFDDRGTFGRSFKITPVGEASFVIGVDVFSDGMVLAKSPLIFAGGIENGLNRRDELFQTHTATGEPVDSLGAFPGPDQFVESGGSGNRRYIAVMTLPFGRSPAAAVYGTRFCFGASDTYEIACYDRDGSLQRLVRRAVSPRPVTSADFEAYKAKELSGIDDEDQRRDAERRFEEMPIPETQPAYATFTLDAVGDLWVREFTAGEAATWTWTVFDPEGRMLGTVAMPADFRVTQIGDEFVLGLWKDDLEVEHVRLYPLIKE